MGTIRTVLALSVVLWHVGPGLAPVTGESAVTCFYIISGFYMSMVLNGPYSEDEWPWKFYLSRFLRLYPAYWAIALVSLVTYLVSESPRHILNFDGTLHPALWAFTIFSNVSIWGLDVLNGIAKAGLFTNHRIIRLVGPAWTLAVELQFYLVAPFIVRRALRWCLIILGVALVIHFLTLAAPEHLRYYLAPSAWCFFLLGHLSHRVSALLTESRVRRNLGLVSIGVVPLCAVLGRVWSYQSVDHIGTWAFYLLFAAAVPFLFERTQNNQLDNAIGGLSYPVYLVHSPFIAIAALIFGGNENELYKLGFWVCAGTVVAVVVGALALHYGLERPIDRIRWRLRSGRAPAVSTA